MVSLFESLEWGPLLLQFAILSACIMPFGSYMANVYQHKPTALSPFLSWAETLLYDMAGIDASKEMGWRNYALTALTFSSLGFIALYIIIVCQADLPGNPAHLPGLAPDKAFVVTASFVTNTQLLTPSFVKMLSPFTCTVGLTVQSFLSAAVGISVFIAIVRGLAGKKTGVVGNFWVDITRTVFYVLLPVSLVFAGLIATSGVAEAVEAFARQHLTSAPGVIPVARDETFKLISTRGGSIINAISTQTGATTPTFSIMNFLSVLLIPAALCYTFNLIVTQRPQPIIAMLAGAGGTMVWFEINAGSQALLKTLVSGDAGLLFGLIAALILTAAGMSWARGQKPRYLGRLLNPFEILMAATACLVPCILILLNGTVQNTIHAAETLNSPATYFLLSLIVLFGRFWVMIPALAIAGSFSDRPTVGAEA